MSRHSTIGCKTCGSEERDVRLVTPAFAGDPHARECDDEWHDASANDLLREEVEKRIRAAWGYDLNEVVGVAVEMIRKERVSSINARQRFVEAMCEWIAADKSVWSFANVHGFTYQGKGNCARRIIEAFADLRCDGHLNEAYASDDKDYREQEKRHNHANCRAFLLRDCGLEVNDAKHG